MSYETIKAEVFDAFESSHDAHEHYIDPNVGYVNKFVEDCMNNKSSLIEMLRKHPNWDEENMRVVVNAEFSRDISTTRATDALYDISYFLRVYAKVNSELFILGEKLRLASYQLSETNRVPDGVTDFFRNVEPKLPEARIKDASKCTRSVMKMLQQYNYESLGDNAKRQIDQAFAIYTDALNELRVTKTTVLSVNPLDFLHMSWGNSWHSCHSIEYGGGWQAGCLSYALDEVTMIVFTLPEATPREDISNTRLQTRELFFWNGQVLVGSRCYPATDDTSSAIYKDTRAVVENIISTCLDIPDQWHAIDRWSVTDESNNRFQYPDYAYHSYKAFVNDFMPAPTNTRFDIGVDRVPCVSCGGYIDESDCLFCNDCEGKSPMVTCEICGDGVEEDDAYYVDGEDAYVCSYCWENEVHCCEYDGHDYFERHMTYLDGVGWVYDYNVDNYRRCPKCRDFFLEDDMYYDEETDEYYCEYCYESLLADREAEIEAATSAIEVLTDATEKIEGGM